MKLIHVQNHGKHWAIEAGKLEVGMVNWEGLEIVAVATTGKTTRFTLEGKSIVTGDFIRSERVCRSSTLIALSDEQDCLYFPMNEFAR